MILLPVIAIALAVSAWSALLPDLKHYIDTRAHADRACRLHAENLVGLYEGIVQANRGLMALRAECGAAAVNPFALAEMQSLSTALVAQQTVDTQLIRAEAGVIHDTGEDSRSVATELLRDPPGDCGVAGDLRMSCDGSPVFDHESAIAGFRVFCKNSRIAWAYHSSRPTEIP